MAHTAFLGNLLPLREVLEEMPETFRTAVWSTLADGGFEVTSDLPCLQLPGDLLEILDSLPPTGEGTRLKEVLLRARAGGVLVDLGGSPRRLAARRPPEVNPGPPHPAYLPC